VEARRQRGWSQEKLAALLRAHGLGTTRKTITRWERDVVPDAAAQAALCDVFGVTPETAQRLGWPHWLPTGRIAAVADSWDHQGTLSALSDVVEGVLVDRRGFLVLTGAELLLPVYEWRLNPGPWAEYQDDGRRQVGTALVEDLEHLVSIRRRMDDEHGGEPLLEMLHADLRFVVDLLKHRSYKGDTGRRLYTVAGEVASLAGWAASESARHAAAQQYSLAALRTSAAVGDRALGVNIIGHMGIQAYSTGRISDATQLMAVAVAEARATPVVVRAMALARAGRAYAKAGNAQAARQALNDANKNLSHAIDGDTPAWAYWVDQTRITAQTGRALFDLGDYPGAMRELAAALGASGDSYPRDRAKWLGQIATAQLRTGNIEASCESGRKAVDLLSGQVYSAQGLTFLKGFRQELAAYKSTGAAREFAAYSSTRLG
jgi:transcriptional regulator with XRE-family HTH domain